MPNYQNGKIYCIRSHQIEEVYVGSTTQPLSVRIGEHRRTYKGYINGKRTYLSVFEMMKYADCYIELVEDFPCNSKEQLCGREGHFIREMNSVNKKIEGRTKAEWRVDNREKILADQKEYNRKNKKKRSEYYQENKDMIRHTKRKYVENNREHVAELRRAGYQRRKEKVLDRNKERVQCQCGKEVCRGALTRHKKTFSHRQAMFNLHNILNHL